MSETKTALVIGGGIAGIEAALKIGQSGHQVILVESSNSLGGLLEKLHRSYPRLEDPAELLAYKLGELVKCPSVTVMMETTVAEVAKNPDGYKVKLEGKNQSQEIDVNAVVIATGSDMMDVTCYGEYGYGVYDKVVNSLEFEALLKEWDANRDKVTPPKTIAFFKCVGSRDRSKGYPYCSKICCMYTAKQAGLVKELFPDTKCYVFYMDYRAAGREYEEFVRSVIEDKKVRYVRGRPAKVLLEDDRLLIRAEDTLRGMPIEVRADMVVLAAALEPSSGTKQMADLFQVKTDKYGFIDYESNEPMKAGDRIFYAGSCGFAVESLGAIQQGAAAAAEVLALFNRGE
ncbi:MAG: CoB--CoM heterodisulfide reductase iron-sulfur subunit A family protein [Syntrophomonadaceae bacterium]|nr:CoB--CoM heterodisulfide reductase iron-sulfur subunit A family protein [Syntrophomonadaceae bacterium]